jgi:DNA-binding transcriptional regulator YhcF (GntR family)
LRNETLEALAKRYISEALRMEFSKQEISQMVKDQLKAWKELQESEE